MAVAVFLLAAGLGTRLRPLTDWLPKPLLPVGDRPALEHILPVLRPLASRLVANTHHCAAHLRAFAHSQAPDLQLSHEPVLLGTAGGLARAAPLLGDGDVLVWNGDILADLDPSSLLDAHRQSPDAAATLAVRPLPAGEGNVGVDANGRVVRLRKETVAPGEVWGGAFLGVHVVGERLRPGLPAEGCLVGDVYLPALRRGAAVLRTFDVRSPWHDIGTLADYEAASWAWLERTGRSSFVGKGVRLSGGVRLGRCIVGDGAEILGEGELRRCIVWPGARVTVPRPPSVVTPWGTVALGEGRE